MSAAASETGKRPAPNQAQSATYRDAQEAIALLRSLANDARTHGMAAELEEMADRVAEIFP